MFRCFTDHPTQVNENYSSNGRRLRLRRPHAAGRARLFVHGFCPWLCLTRGSDTVRMLHHRMVTHRDAVAAARSAPRPSRQTNRPAGSIVGASRRRFPVGAQERSMVPVTVDGETVNLAIITTSRRAGPFPILIFHHGSTGRGNDFIFAPPYDARCSPDGSRRVAGRSCCRHAAAAAARRAVTTRVSRRPRRDTAASETMSLPGADRALPTSTR